MCPGEVVSVDEMISPTPGLLVQTTGRPAKERYNYTTVYVDTYYGYPYTHMQKTQYITETIEGKHAFEAYCKHHRVYHADNGTFKAKDWVNDCKVKQQSLIFVGVSAHHNNGRAETRIRLLQDLARSMLIHADRRWAEGQ